MRSNKKIKMDKLRESIDILFRRVLLDDILDRFFHPDPKRPPMAECIDDKTFSDNAIFFWSPGVTHDEIETFCHRLKNKELFDHSDMLNKKSVFFLLSNFAQEILIEKNGEPLCKYEQLLKWNDISRKLGEDIFTTALLAYNDFKASENRHFFSWPPIIRTTNNRLHQMLSKGMAENHFHLKGSAPYFSLSWLSLMNSFKNREEAFGWLRKESRMEPEIFSQFTPAHLPDMYTLVKKAACIRVFLFCKLNSIPFLHSPSPSQVLNVLTPGREMEFEMRTHKIQRDIDLLKYDFDHRFGREVADYAIPKNPSDNNFNGNILLYGERNFLYSMFKKMLQQDKHFIEYRDLFYAYLVIKEKLSQELLQVNEWMGFANFEKYQNRKEYFIKRNSIFEEALYCMAVNTTLKNQKIVSFETRITPPSSWESNDIEKSIKKCDTYIKSKKFDNPGYSPLDNYLLRRHLNDEKENPQHNHFYTLHFYKRKEFPEKANENALYLVPRNNATRLRIKKEAHSIVRLRDGLSASACRIRGIDAAANEIGCRPEVFAQVFRFLKSHWTPRKYEHYKEKGKNDIKKLGATYHAGEDFLDMVDGLRAIEEAVEFLNLTHGDRLGHALALGIDPFDYYELKEYRIILSKQDLLDNIVWMLSKIQKYAASSFPTLIYFLEKEYSRLFSELYGNCRDITECGIPPHSMYYDAWRLRGDNPMFYFDYEKGCDKKKPELTFWDRCAINREDSKVDAIREIESITKLYSLYHFSPHVKFAGDEIEEFRVEKSYIQAVKVIQEEMQKKIRDKGIGIETNPSSNYLIGCFRSYIKHPILNFYNLGLTYDREKLEKCPQLFVSINTDDQGVFNTYLEKEYALMALALEKEEDEYGNKVYNSAMIYDWLDRIRQMGVEQSFQYDEIRK